jgi:hypothetical protein
MNGHSAHTPAPITFRVLGPLEVEGTDGRPIDVCGGKPATMLALLLLHRNAWVSTGQLIEAVWAGHDIPASAQRNLKTYVWQLRRALPEERIESRPSAYLVCVLPGELDADALHRRTPQPARRRRHHCRRLTRSGGGAAHGRPRRQPLRSAVSIRTAVVACHPSDDKQ